MVVKKFEARSMKEALEMIKREMGPDAIIMAARDNSRRYGLVGEGSVEITAAIHPDQLQKKKFAESKLNASTKEKVQKGSAKIHKELIEKSYVGATARGNSSATISRETQRAPVERNQKYIEMVDDVEPASAPNGVNDKLKVAAEKAWRMMQVNSKEQHDDSSLQELRGEIKSLQEIFKNMREMPQSIVQGHPGSEFGLHYELAGAFERLAAVGISEAIIVEILKEVQERLPEKIEKNNPMISALVAQALARRIEIVSQPDFVRFEVFVGAGGHGKTTTLIKYAADLALNQQKRVAIISTDTQKFGSSEQLKIYAQILNIPFMVINDYEQWDLIGEEASNFDKILIDTPGIRFRKIDELQMLKQVLPPAKFSPRVHLVLSATAKDQDAIELGKRFASVGFDDVIFTALDESVQHGVLINFQEAVGKPFHSFGLGPRVPEDYEKATKERVIDLLMNISNETYLSQNINL